MLPWKLRKRQILPVNQNLSSVYSSLAKFQLVNYNLSLAMIWQMMYTHKLPKLCSATLMMPSGKLCSRQPKKALRQRTMRAGFSLIRALISNKHTERIIGSYEKLFGGDGGGVN